MNDGGPAFPNDSQDGMSLRDYFAAKAMHAYITRNLIVHGDVAKYAYEMADAMLKEREKQ